MSSYKVAEGRTVAHAGRFYQAGESVDIDDKRTAEDLLDGGYLEEASSRRGPRAKADAPAKAEAPAADKADAPADES